MSHQSFGSGVGIGIGLGGSPKSFPSYSRAVEVDLEAGEFVRSSKKHRKTTKNSSQLYRMMYGMINYVRNKLYYQYKLHPITVVLCSLTMGILFALFMYRHPFLGRMSFFWNGSIIPFNDAAAGNSNFKSPVIDGNEYASLRNLVMVAGHSVYTSNNCERADSEGSWLLEPYQRHPGQAASFVQHIREGVEIAASDKEALLLFSGGETRRDAGPRSEAQSYWAVADSKGWFGKQESVKWRAITEEHARDSFENLLFSICRFRELTGVYPYNITVVSYDFKEERFSGLHRAAITFPENRFFYFGTPASPTSKSAALKGEALVRSQFKADPFGCFGTLHRKRLKRDPFRRSIPYPDKACPEMSGLFSYCGLAPYNKPLPWTQ